MTTIMNSSQLSEENSNNELFKVFDKLNYEISHKELKKVKQEKESLIIQLSELHALINSLRSNNTMLFNTIDAHENKLKESKDLLEKFSSDNLKSMLCIQTDNSNKPGLIIDDLDASTSHASDSELNSFFIKLMIINTACLDSFENSCLNNSVKPKSRDSGTQDYGKFVPTSRNCGKVGHMRPNCFLLKTHRSWIKQDASRKGKVEKPSPSKYVPPHRRHIKGKDSVICKNANLNSAETVKKFKEKKPAHLPSLRDHRSHST